MQQTEFTKESANAHIRNPLLLPIVGASLAMVLAGQAQTFTALYNFTGNGDGGAPLPGSGLVVSGNIFYGTAGTINGVSIGGPVVYAVNTDGTGFTTIYEGVASSAPLVLSGNTLYGTQEFGGDLGHGMVFAVNTDGTGFTTLHSFAGSPSEGDRAHPGLVLSGNTLYGTTWTGGASDNGTVFSVNTDGSGFASLYSFSRYDTNGFNNDGSWPNALLLSGNTLYGTANLGGSAGYGTAFKLQIDGTGFTTLHQFTRTPTNGGGPAAGLILSDSVLYGTTYVGGSGGAGTVFSINTDGGGFRNLYSFSPTYYSTNSDGANPSAALILFGNTLYGTTSRGGSSDSGTLFTLNTDGTGFSTPYDFTSAIQPDNSGPVLIASGNTFYGATLGAWPGLGVVFSISLPITPPQLTITPGAANVILTWPTNFAGFSLQSSVDLGSSVTWGAVSTPPAVINGLNTVTNLISGTQQFYRLSQ